MRLPAAWALLVLLGCSSTPRSESAVAESAAPEAPRVTTSVVPEKVPVAPAGPLALDAQPAAVPMPDAPPLQRVTRDSPEALKRDQSGELTRNASVVGRLPQVGHRAAFPFESAAGEQSLFEIAGFGYSRAGAGRVRMAIEDESGAVAWESERAVSATWRDFVAFAPPAAGNYVFSIGVLEGGYRFVLVRHSDYPVLMDAALDLGSRERVHGHLPNADSIARFSVPVKAGEELALKLTGTREEARNEARRGATDMSTMMSRMDATMDQTRMTGGPKLLFQTFDLEASVDGVALGPVGPYLRLTAPRDGALEVRVRAHFSGLGGGLFDLAVERPLDLLHVHGVVVDSEDQPLSGVELLFLREPDADPVGKARTNQRGEYDASVLAGDLAVQMLRARRTARTAVHVQVTADTQLDLLYEPGAKPRGR